MVLFNNLAIGKQTKLTVVKHFNYWCCFNQSSIGLVCKLSSGRVTLMHRKLIHLLIYTLIIQIPMMTDCSGSRPNDECFRLNGAALVW